MKKLITLLILLTLSVLTLVGCSVGGMTFDMSGMPGIGQFFDPVEEKEEELVYQDPTHQTGTYEVFFNMGPNSVIHYYEFGELPDPPEFESVKIGAIEQRYYAWSTPLLPVTGDTTYKGVFETIEHTYTASFVMGDQVVEVETLQGYVAQPPADPGDYNGMKFVCWDRAFTQETEDTTYYAVYTNMFDPFYYNEMYHYNLMGYSAKLTDTDQAGGVLPEATALYTLCLQEYSYPMDGGTRNRIIASLNNVVAENNAPCFDLSCHWNYCFFTAALALARNTPTVWDNLPVDTQLRMSFMMECYAYVESFGTSDYNSFQTGPGLKGNYAKTWNPNYRLANIPVMIFATAFFGVGDLTKGADILNAKIRSFSESTYNTCVEKFGTYGWRRAARVWTTAAKTVNDGGSNEGFVGDDARTLLCFGGNAVGDTTDNSDGETYTRLGSGVGVNNGGKDYLYQTYSLYELDKIVESLINYNYSGGQVKDDHWYNVKNPETGVSEYRQVAWINPNYQSPYLGLLGRMREYNSGNRSKNGYCSEDFILTTCLLSACDALGIYDYTSNEDIWNLIQVGNADFLFKYYVGYKGYATGSYGVNDSLTYERVSATAYYIHSMRSLWYLTMETKGDVYETYEPNGSPADQWYVNIEDPEEFIIEIPSFD